MHNYILFLFLVLVIEVCNISGNHMILDINIVSPYDFSVSVI